MALVGNLNTVCYTWNAYWGYRMLPNWGGGHGKSDIYARLTCLEQIITIIFTKYMIIYVLLV